VAQIITYGKMATKSAIHGSCWIYRLKPIAQNTGHDAFYGFGPFLKKKRRH
jgi:hypothetical protein